MEDIGFAKAIIMRWFTVKIKLFNLFSKPIFANLKSSFSEEVFSLPSIEGRIGFDFLGLKLNLK